MLRLFFILFFTISIYGNSASPVDWEIESFYADTTHTLKIDDIVTLDKNNQFEAYLSKGHVFSKSYNKSSYWIKVIIQNNDVKSLKRVFKLGLSWLDSVSLYLLNSNGIINQWHLGDTLPYEAKNNKLLYPTIKLQVSPGKNILYVRVHTIEPLIVPFMIDTEEKIVIDSVKQLSFFASIYAALFVMGLYNLFLYFSVKDKNYLFYTLFVFSFIVMNSTYTGLQYQFFTHNSTYWPTYLNPFFILVYQYFGILFLISFLETKINLPKIHKFLLSYIFIATLVQLSAYLFNLDNFLQQFALICATLYGPTLMAIALYSLQRRNLSNYLFIWGIFSSLVGTMITALSAYGILPYTFYYFHAVEFGFILDAILLSLALAAKLKQITYIAYENSKLSSLGEMIGNIAHQWRQPLTELSYINGFLIEYLSSKDVKTTEKLYETDKILQFMSHTIESFQNFYKNDSKQVDFNIANSIEMVLELTHQTVKQNNINIFTDVEEGITAYGVENHLTQVLLAIIQNSINVIKKENIIEGKIWVSIVKKENKITILTLDNGGGITIKPMESIFNTFITTRESLTPGIGLYMAKKIIIEKFFGNISVENTSIGAKFKITFETCTHNH